jgi:hypothetical protein
MPCGGPDACGTAVALFAEKLPHAIQRPDLPAIPGTAVSMEGEESRWLDGLAHHVGLDADAAHIADVIVSTMREIEAVLRPVVSRRAAAQVTLP